MSLHDICALSRRLLSGRKFYQWVARRLMRRLPPEPEVAIRMVLPFGWRVPVLIHVTANGRIHAVPAGLALADFLKMQGWPLHLVAVTRNGLALAPAETALTTLENGDVLEIVRIGADG